MNLASLLQDNAKSFPDRLCLITPDKQVTFAELESQSGQLAAMLSENAIKKGDVALVFVPVGIELYAILIALFRIGAVAMLVDPAAGKKHIDACCELAQPTVFIGTPKAHLLRLLSSPLRRIRRAMTVNGWVPAAKTIRLARVHSDVSEQSRFETGPHDPALITFTSGSTGLPKGVYRTHRFLINQHKAIENALSGSAADIEINTLPVFILSSIGSGLTSIIPNCDLRNPGTIDPGPVIHQAENLAVNRILAPPAFCQRLAEHLRSSGKQLPGIKKVCTGGGPVFPNLLALLQQVFPNAAVVAVYGSTEAEPMSHIEYREISESDMQAMQHGAGLLAGHPVPEVNLRILPDKFGERIGPYNDAEFARLCQGSGEIGEIVVTGPHVLKAYLDNVNPDGIKFKVGENIWHRTGDAGYIDEHGRLWLLGRCQAKLVLQAGGTIYPFGVETTALTHEQVTRAAFVRCNDRNILVIELASESFDSQLLSKLDSVDEVRVVSGIPVDKRHNSKIDYVALGKLLQTY